MALIESKYTNRCSCGIEFKGTAFPELELVSDKNGALTNKTGDKVSPMWCPALVADGCPKCQKRLAKETEAKYYAELDALSMEERVRRIEKWIKEFKHPEPRYVSPPKF